MVGFLAKSSKYLSNLKDIFPVILDSIVINTGSVYDASLDSLLHLTKVFITLPGQLSITLRTCSQHIFCTMTMLLLVNIRMVKEYLKVMGLQPKVLYYILQQRTIYT